jgi:hypothetical protein
MTSEEGEWTQSKTCETRQEITCSEDEGYEYPLSYEAGSTRFMNVMI